jgi:signal recognition particle receptor subunit beta
MIEKFLVISYFDSRIGPNILYHKSDISNIYEFPDLSRILDFSNEDNTFLFSFRKFQTINTIFNMKSDIARGGTELIMISCIIRASYFKNELTDIFKYLDSKKVILEEFVSELKELPNFNLILHKYNKNPTKKQFTDYCKEENVDFFSIYEKYYDLIFPESEIKLITQDINLKKKILLIGPKGSGKDTFLQSIENLQFIRQNNLDIPTRIIGIIIDNIILSNTSDFLNDRIGLDIAQAMIFMINNKDKDTTNEVNLLIDKFISSYSIKTFGKIPLLIINNIIKGKTPLRAKEIKQFFKLEKVKKKKIPFKYYSINVIKVDPILFEPLYWLIKQIFT